MASKRKKTTIILKLFTRTVNKKKNNNHSKQNTENDGFELSVEIGTFLMLTLR